MAEYSYPTVSTITATASLGCAIDIVTVAKRVALDGHVSGAKMTYADGSSIVVRGDSKPPKSRGGFFNQTSLVVHIGQGRKVHVKVFSNGKVQIAGPKSMDEVSAALRVVADCLSPVRGCCSVDVEQTDDGGPLVGMDGVVYSTRGDIVGWRTKDSNFFIQESVAITAHEGSRCFVSTGHRAGRRNLYSLDGVLIGERFIQYTEASSRRRRSVVENGKVFAGGEIVGKEITTVIPGWNQILHAELGRRKQIAAEKVILHCYRALLGRPSLPADQGVEVHMVNAVVLAPFPIVRANLHRCFLADDYVSRWDPCANPGVSLRYYDNPLAGDAQGRCPCQNRLLCCSCKKINMRCFDSGIVIVTGLRDVDQLASIDAFIQSYFRAHRHLIARDGKH
jgi:hypothetical protein